MPDSSMNAFGGTKFFGGAGRDRTDDLKLAKLPLSQLSYGPILCLWPAGQTRKSSRRAFALAALRAVRKQMRDRQTMPKASQGRMAAAHVCEKAERRMSHKMVGLGGLEPPTSRLSSARSNQLSYKPEPWTRERCSPGPVTGLVREERETKTAVSRSIGLTGRVVPSVPIKEQALLKEHP